MTQHEDPVVHRLRATLDAVAGGLSDQPPGPTALPTETLAAQPSMRRLLMTAAALVMVGATGIALASGGTAVEETGSLIDLSEDAATGSTVKARSGTPSTTAVASDWPIAVDRPQTIMMAAQMIGAVELHDGCIAFSNPESDGDPPPPIVWPHGTTWDPSDGGAVVLPDGQLVRPGSRIESGGGYTSLGAFSDRPEVYERLEACLAPSGSRSVAVLGWEFTVDDSGE